MYAPFSNTGENKNLMSFNLFWEVMRKKPQWTKQDLVRYTYKHATSAQLDEHLKTLVTMKKIQFVPTNGQVIYAVLDQAAL